LTSQAERKKMADATVERGKGQAFDDRNGGSDLPARLLPWCISRHSKAVATHIVAGETRGADRQNCPWLSDRHWGVQLTGDLPVKACMDGRLVC